VTRLTTTISASVVGLRDRNLEELLQACSILVTPLKLEELGTLAQPGALQPDVVLLDVREKNTVPPSIGMLRRQHPTTGVVIIAASLEPALMLEAMRAGVTEFLTTPLTAPDLQAAINRVTTQGAAGSKGEVFAFVGAKGGVGTTTVAVNVATALGQIDPGSTLLIDLHLAYGDAAVFLGTEPRYSVVDALENVHRLDKAFFSGLVGQARGGLALLASSDRASATPVDSASIRSLIDAAARHYAHVLLDVPRNEVMLDALESASRIVIVANQELATVRAATRLSASLRQRYGRERLSIVISRFDQQSDIAQSDVERVLGSPVAHTFPSNYRIALEALNAGRPVVLDNHNKLAASLTGFARGLVDTTEDAVAGSSRRQNGIFGRLTGRRP
jgi:pilus assembly protein CpaE